MNYLDRQSSITNMCRMYDRALIGTFFNTMTREINLDLAIDIYRVFTRWPAESTRPVVRLMFNDFNLNGTPI